MTSVTVKAFLGEDRRLTIDLPPGLPTGPVEVTVSAVPAAPTVGAGGELTREQARAILAAAGLLSTARLAPPGTVRLTPEEEEELGQLFAGEPDMATLISQDREERWD